MTVILQKADKLLLMVMFFLASVKNWVVNEIRRIKNDESGIEIVQVILILVIVIIIAAALWIFLKDTITGWLQKIGTESNKISSDKITP